MLFNLLYFLRLYDPRVTALRKVLHGEVFFPSDKFSDTETLETLNTLGLRKTLGYSGLIDCARSVSLLHFSRDSEALSYGRKLLRCLDALSFKLSTEEEGNFDESMNSDFQNDTAGDAMYVESPKSNENETIDLDINSFVDNLIGDKPEQDFWSDMRAIAWCPVCVDPPLTGIPWLKSSNQVASPSNVRPKSQMFMVSSSMHILDGVCRSTYLQKKLGWMDRPNINVLSTQLIELPKLYFQLKSHSSDIPDVDASLCEGIPSLYSKLQEYMGTDEFSELKSALHGVSWVWIGDNFVAPNALAFDSPVKFTPYLYVVPSELSEFRDLLIRLGVRISFDILDYLHVLQRLRNDVKGFPLSTDQLNFTHCVLDAVADCCSEKSPFEASNTPILIPDSSGVLMDAGDLVYNDAPWMEHSTLVGKHFIHPTISNDLADRLGVQSLRSLSLVDDEMTKDLPCMDYARIKELLASYGDNDLLLFDLLELADCCKANKLHLIFDKREHPRQSLLQHNMGKSNFCKLLLL